MPLTKEEINRKLLHIVSGTAIPAGILYIPKLPFSWVSDNTPLLILIGLLMVSLAVEMIRFRLPAVQNVFQKFAGSMLRSEEDKSITGATWIFASAVICTLVFRDQPSISAVCISLFILGDAIAAIVGLSIGRIKIGKKSLEGSLACLVCCFVLLFGIFPHVPDLCEAFGGTMPLAVGITGAFSITLLELFPIKVGKISLNDNLYVPVVTGILIRSISSIF